MNKLYQALNKVGEIYQCLSTRAKLALGTTILVAAAGAGAALGVHLGEEQGYQAGCRDTEAFWKQFDPESYQKLTVSERITMNGKKFEVGVMRMSTPLETRLAGEPHAVIVGNSK